jgi:hypothetical protein
LNRRTKKSFFGAATFIVFWNVGALCHHLGIPLTTYVIKKQQKAIKKYGSGTGTETKTALTSAHHLSTTAEKQSGYRTGITSLFCAGYELIN